MFKNSKGQLVTAEEAAADLNAQLDAAEAALQLEKYKSPLDERAAFEAHESKERRLSPADQRTWFRRGAIADYDCKVIDDAWKAWQARAALPTEPLSIQFVNAVKQLCKDFSDRQDRPYMGDVYSALDALLVNVGIRLEAGQLPDALRSAFMTADSGHDKYQVVIRFSSLKDMQAAHEYLVKHLGQQRSAGSVS